MLLDRIGEAAPVVPSALPDAMSGVFIGPNIPTRSGLQEHSVAQFPRPHWLKTKLKTGPNFRDLKGLVNGLELHTVCEQASCPNIFECWEAKEATFLILGGRCTRRCAFCDIETGKPAALDWEEPARVAEAVKHLGLEYAVITGVERDDASPVTVAQIWAATVASIRERVPGCKVELLTGDLKGREEAIHVVVNSTPDVFAHNLETPRRLHRKIRPGFRYDRSLEMLRLIKRLNPRQPTKSNLIVGMGETFEEVLESMRDLRSAQVDLLTIGQYLSPSLEQHLPVRRWVDPDEFKEYARVGQRMGFAWVESGPLVRSSYHAGKQYRAALADLSH